MSSSTSPDNPKSKQVLDLPPFTSADAAPEQRMHWVRTSLATVEALYESGVFKAQRNHVRRLKAASHLTNGSAIPLHVNYLAVRLPNLSMQLIDGYTRLTAVKEGLAPRPEEVWLGVVDVDSPKQAEQLYLAVDSRKAVKTGRDAFEEGLRKAGLLAKLSSPMFINGYAVSAIAVAAGDKDVLKNVVKFKKAIERLDPLQLEVGRFALPAGALGASILLAQNEKDTSAVLQFTAAVMHPDQLTPQERALVPGAIKFANWLKDRRAEGALSGRNVIVIMQQALGSYIWQQNGASGRIEPVSREDYLGQLSKT